MPGGEAIRTYAAKVKQIHRTGAAMPETSYYPALDPLLADAARSGGEFPLVPLSQVSGVAFGTQKAPDYGLIEQRSRILAVPIEVKSAAVPLEVIFRSRQAVDYARIFGGGKVMATNLWQWGLAELQDDGTLVERVRQRVTLAESGDDFLAGRLAPDLDSQWDKLSYLIVEATVRRGTISDPRVVAGMLAHHAKLMRGQVLAAGDPDRLFASLRRALLDGLQMDLSGEHVAPTVVQTLVYGTFAAWLEADEPERFDWMQSAYRACAPVFAEILHEALRPAVLRRCDLVPHLEDVERVLRWTDRAAFTAGFDGDAFAYFYEPFLAAFDPVLRRDLGVWYTPRQVADYQVARIDHHLRADLRIDAGLADEQVFLLDPAVGTGTYLAAACDFLFRYHTANGEPGPVAAQKCLQAMTTRFIGFDVLPAAFVICNLHLARHLTRLGANSDGARLRIYLTNSLTGWTDESTDPAPSLFPELAAELQQAAGVKQATPILAVLGNPPYQGYATIETVEEKAMMAPWKAASTQRWGLRKLRLDDLYVRFWLMAMRRIVTLSGRGVVSFITNRKWLGGRSYPAMRDAISAGFDTVWVDDLHGSVHAGEDGDESVFSSADTVGIRVGTAIVTAVLGGGRAGGGRASVHVRSYRGSSQGKRGMLAGCVARDAWGGYEAVPMEEGRRYRFVEDTDEDWPCLDEYLPVFFSGVQLTHNYWAFDTDRERLRARLAAYFDSGVAWGDLVARFPQFGVGNAKVLRPALQRLGFDEDRIVALMFKPLDRQWVYWETRVPHVLHRDRSEMFRHWQVGGQVCLVAAQTPRRPTGARPFPSRSVPSMESVDPNARCFPLYPPSDPHVDMPVLFGAQAAVQAETLVAPEWVGAAAKTLGCGERDAGEAVFYALVAVTNSPAWLACQEVESDDFPSVPLPADADMLGAAAGLGRRLVALFDPSRDVPGVTSGRIDDDAIANVGLQDHVAGRVPLAGRLGYSGGIRSGSDVLWEPGGGKGWHEVPDAVWDFAVGGFPVLPKWLSYRVGDLSEGQRDEFRLLCRRVVAVLETRRQCDTVFERASTRMLLPG